MIRLIVRIGAWLDKRFPAKVVLTQADLQEMKKRVEIAIASCGDLMSLHHTHEDAISELEKSIDGIKDLLAKAAQVGAQAQKSRADYIASGRMAE